MESRNESQCIYVSRGKKKEKKHPGQTNTTPLGLSRSVNFLGKERDWAVMFFQSSNKR